MSDLPRQRVLVVDDEDSIRDSIEAFLDDLGYQVQSASNAADAMKLVEITDFDIAIVDLELGEINGDTFILNVADDNPDMKFLMYTASLDFQLTEELIGKGLRYNNVLTKPIHDLALLERQVRKILTQTG